MEKNEKLVLIDGNSLINRAFYALPLLTNSEGEYSNAVYGFCNMLTKLIEAENPKYMAVAFDMGHPTFRHEMYAEYKAGRKKMPDELASQLPILKSVLASMNISFVEKPGIEADDIIGTLAKKFNIPTIILSGDRDLFQLVDETTSVWFTKRGISDTIVVTPQNIQEVYGVKANQVADLKALMGDSSDNIKGVAGVGEKTAKALISEYGSIENVYANLNNIKNALHDKLANGKQDAEFSKKLATIFTEALLDISLEDLTFDFPFKNATYDLFKHYEFNSLLKRPNLFEIAEVQTQKKEANINYISSADDLQKLVDNLKTTPEFAINFAPDQIHIANSKFQENVIKLKQNLIDDGLADAEVFNILAPILQDKKIKKIVINEKNLMHHLALFGAKLCGEIFDANIALYLLSGSKKTDYDAKTFTEKYDFAENAICTCLISTKQQLLEELEKEGMTKLFFEVEMPLVPVLFEMEQNGFKIDLSKLKELEKEYNAELENLTKQILQDADEDFNIKSPKQLGEVLFDKMGLKPPKNVKKSTGVEVLERIANQHPIINKILRFRKIEKLYGTYIEPFGKIADKQTGLIHTIFNQTLTATGRLSSSEPNLQNIPVRDEEGKMLRKIFIPRVSGGKIVTSDYSQIELRLLAHYSKDARLMYAYNNNIDIHSQTASDIFGVPINEITSQMRRDAKTVNFGIIYGISDYGLATNLGTDRKTAKEFIDKYFETYSEVKDFMNSSIEKAKELGYVTTLFGRKRNIEEINSDNYMTREFGKRAAMNMPLQGTASDIIKIAMINVFGAMKKQNLKSKLILQIHDELIVDAVPEEVEIVKELLKIEMESAVKLSIKLEAEVNSGDNWFDAK